MFLLQALKRNFSCEEDKFYLFGKHPRQCENNMPQAAIKQ
jgi:hypothetical protein